MVSLMEMCRSEMAKLAIQHDPPANSDSKARTSIEGKSFAEARKQDELLAMNDKETSFNQK